MGRQEEIYNYEQEQEIRGLLVGRKIVAVDEAAETLTLDDGTELKILPNEGMCCSNGDYFVRRLVGAENVILAVDFSEQYLDKDQRSEPGDDYRYEIFVYTEGVENGQSILRVDGSDGNGYYGTGYKIRVKR